MQETELVSENVPRSSTFDPNAHLNYVQGVPEIQRRLTTNLKPLPDQNDLSFGRYFSDHWFYSKYSKSSGWHTAAIEPYGNLQLDPAASVLHYGQALFEGMKAFLRQDGSIALFRPEFNFQRLQQGAARLCLEAPPRELFMEALKQLISVDSRWVPKSELSSLYIRPTLIGTEAFLGVRPSKEELFFILLSPVGSYFNSRGALRIWIEEHAMRATPGGLGDTKAGANYAASLQAALKAKERGYDQVLWLDTHHDGIEEVGTMNVFFVLKDEVVTPALNGSILEGGMRNSVLQLLRSEGARVSERRITVTELMDRHKKGEVLEAFGTGTAAVISPIGEFHFKDQTMVIGQQKTGPVSQRLFEKITNIQYGRSKDPFQWMKALNEL